MSAALIEIRDVDGKLSCSVHWCDDNAETIVFDFKSGAHRAATKVIAFMDEAFGRLDEPAVSTVATAADVEAALIAAQQAGKAEQAPAGTLVLAGPNG